MSEWRLPKLFFNPIVLLGLLFIGIIWFLALNRISDERRNDEQQLAGQAANIAVAFEQNVFSAVTELDDLLKFIRELHVESGRKYPWSTIVNARFTINTATAQIGLIGADGYAIASTTAMDPKTPVYLGDREHFIVHAQSKRDQLFISKPVLGRVSKKWSIQLSRPFFEPDGSFGGVLVASLDPEVLTSRFKELKLGANGGVALLGDDDIFRAGTGTFSDRFGRPHREPDRTSSVRMRIEPKSVTSATVEIQEIGGKTSFVATNRVAGLPLQVMVAMSDDPLSSHQSRGALSYVLLAALCTLGVAGALMLVVRSQNDAMNSLEQRNKMELEKKVAESAAKDRSIFLAVMSHEIRTPLNGVLGALDLIRNETLTERTRRFVNIATDAGEGLLRLIDDILLFSKSENDEIPLANEPFVIDALVHSVRETMLPLASKQGNVITVSTCDSSKHAVIGDSPRLRQVLLNLLGNANKFTKDGTLSIIVEELPAAADSLGFRIEVRDTGIGIPADKIKLIFNHFETLDPSYSRRTDGTGLGLAICDKLVQAMGGTIAVQSEVGKGSCFAVELTFERTDLQSISRPENEPADKNAAAVKGLRILLAEDNPTNTFVVTEFLTDAGHHIVHASNGRAAVAAAMTEPFDVILMDISMPEMDGMEATAKIRSSAPINATTKIVALTAHAVAGDRDKFLAAGMDAYVTKPIRKQTLLSTLDALFSGKLVEEGEERSERPRRNVVNAAEFANFVGQSSFENVCKIMTIFTTDLSRIADALEKVIAAKDLIGLQMLSHSMVGSGGLVGAERLVGECREIEARCKNREPIDWTTAKELLVTIKATSEAFDRLKDKGAFEAFTGRSVLAA